MRLRGRNRSRRGSSKRNSPATTSPSTLSASSNWCVVACVPELPPVPDIYVSSRPFCHRVGVSSVVRPTMPLFSAVASNFRWYLPSSDSFSKFRFVFLVIRKNSCNNLRTIDVSAHKSNIVFSLYGIIDFRCLHIELCETGTRSLPSTTCRDVVELSHALGGTGVTGTGIARAKKSAIVFGTNDQVHKSAAAGAVRLRLCQGAGSRYQGRSKK